MCYGVYVLHDVMQGDMTQVLLNIQVTIQVKSGQQTLLKHSMHNRMSPWHVAFCAWGIKIILPWNISHTERGKKTSQMEYPRKSKYTGL